MEYEELPAVTNAVEGMKPDAPLIHPDLHTYKVAPIFHPGAPYQYLPPL